MAKKEKTVPVGSLPADACFYYPGNTEGIYKMIYNWPYERRASIWRVGASTPVEIRDEQYNAPVIFVAQTAIV